MTHPVARTIKGNLKKTTVEGGGTYVHCFPRSLGKIFHIINSLLRAEVILVCIFPVKQILPNAQIQFFWR